MIVKLDRFWLQRWNALYDSISATIQENEFDQRFELLLTELRDFGTRQFCYFYFGFLHDLLDELKNPFLDNEDNSVSKDEFEEALKHESLFPQKEFIEENLKTAGYFTSSNTIRIPQRLVIDREFPPDFVLRSLLDQIAYDYEVIKRAAYQRLLGAEMEKNTLCKADNWGQLMLKPLSPPEVEGERRKMLDVEPIVISYYNRSPQIRMIPYAAVALIGIPQTATKAQQRRDLLIIPHELGHYIYWHGQLEGMPLRSILRDLVRGELPFIRQWIEEIFADVCGLIISGEPAMVPIALNMIRDNAPNVYVQSEAIHPIDAVRFEIYASSLKRIAEMRKLELGNILDTLQRSIDELDKATGGFETIKMIDRHGDQVSFELKEIRQKVSNVGLYIVNEIMMPSFPISNWDNRLDPRKDEDKKSSLEKDTLEKLAALGILEAYQDLLSSKMVEDWYGKFEERINSVPESNDLEASLPRSKYRRAFMKIRDTLYDRPLESSVWKIVFAADGWTVKGPETGPTGDWEADWTRSTLHQ